MKRKTDPIKRIELADGRVRYRFVVDVGEKPRLDAEGKPVLDESGRQVMMRDQRTFTMDKLKEARTERARIIAESARGTYVKPTKATVEQLVADWLEVKERSVKPTSRAGRAVPAARHGDLRRDHRGGGVMSTLTSNPQHVGDLPTALVRVALVELAKRGIVPDFDWSTYYRTAVPAAELLLHALGVEWSVLDAGQAQHPDLANGAHVHHLPASNVVDFAAYRARKGAGRDA